MAEIHKIKDLYVLKFHARQQGLSMRRYLAEGRKMGLTTGQMIDSAYKSQSLERRSSIEAMKRSFRRLGVSALGVTMAYALNFSVNLAIARNSLPEGFDSRQEAIASIKGEIRNYENDVRGLPDNDFRRMKLAGMYYDLQWNYVMQEPAIWEYQERMERAYNPLRFLE